MARKPKTYTDLIRLARSYGVDKNALFLKAAEQYVLQQKTVLRIQEAIESEEDLLTVKEYVKGRENVCLNPLVKELPKHTEAANKTLTVMLDIITKLGKPPAPRGKLEQLLNDE